MKYTNPYTGFHAHPKFLPALYNCIKSPVNRTGYDLMFFEYSKLQRTITYTPLNLEHYMTINEWGTMKFVPARLDETQMMRFEAMKDDILDELPFRLEALLTDDYKLTVSFAEKQQAFIGTIVPRRSQRLNAGYCLSAWAATPHAALAMVLYKHQELFNSGEWPKDSPGQQIYG